MAFTVHPFPGTSFFMTANTLKVPLSFPETMVGVFWKKIKKCVR